MVSSFESVHTLSITFESFAELGVLGMYIGYVFSYLHFLGIWGGLAPFLQRLK